MGLRRMGNKGYVLSLMVFLILFSVFLMAITYSKSITMMEQSAYESVAIMKASRLGRNMVSMGLSARLGDACAEFQKYLHVSSGDQLPVPVTISVDCAVNKVLIQSPSGRYQLNMSIPM